MSGEGRVAALQSLGPHIVFGPILQVSDFASAFPENRVPLFGPMLDAEQDGACFGS